jgi:hypothetical protein
MFTLCRKSKSKECKMSGSFVWVCICILEGGRFSIMDANADPGLVGIVLRAMPLTLHPHLHLHFYIRDADADAGKCPLNLASLKCE